MKDKLEYLDEVAKLEYEEWTINKEVNKKQRIEKKIHVMHLIVMI